MGAALAMTAVAGCGAVDGRGAAAAGVAARMLGAVVARDGSAACALLAPGTLADLEQSADRPCAQAILAEDLPEPGAVVSTEVYGQRAQVRLDGDTVFLAVLPDGWRVVAAGCTVRDDRPYDCVVRGG